MSDLAAIQNHINRYTDAVNRRDWDAFPKIFAEDATWEGIGIDLKFKGLKAITKGISGIVDAMSWFVQMNAPALIIPYGDRAVARSAIHELGDVPKTGMHFDVYGRYEDELVKIRGFWRFKRRVFIRISRKETPIDG
jgi:ketosteroid isomerase-like protein